MNAPTPSEGPRTLPLMPVGQQAALDPYMALIVGYRKSGLSLNHIIGCPLDCGYCVRHFWGNFEVKTPHLLCTDDQAVDLLAGRPARTAPQWAARGQRTAGATAQGASTTQPRVNVACIETVPMTSA